MIEADKLGVRSLRLVPTIISDFQVNKEAQETLQRKQQLSEIVS
jgi:hypothetical protein